MSAPEICPYCGAARKYPEYPNARPLAFSCDSLWWEKPDMKRGEPHWRHSNACYESQITALKARAEKRDELLGRTEKWIGVFLASPRSYKQSQEGREMFINQDPADVHEAQILLSEIRKEAPLCQ